MELMQILGNKSITGKNTPISHIMSQKDSMFDVIIEGTIFAIDIKGPFKNGNKLYSGAIYDKTSSMYFKFFSPKDIKLKTDQFMRLSGKVEYDNYKKELVFDATPAPGLETAVMLEKPKEKTEDEPFVPLDQSENRRGGELAFRSKMSRHDSTLSVEDGVNLSVKMGYSYMGLTDREVVQGYPDAFNTVKKMDNFKLIYGVVMNMVDDTQPIVFGETSQRIDEVPYTVWDFETTGLSNEDDDLIELGATKMIPFKGFYCSSCKEKHSHPENSDTLYNRLLSLGICPSCFGLKKKEAEDKGMFSLYNELSGAIKDGLEEQTNELMEQFEQLSYKSLERITHVPSEQFREIIFTKKEITAFITGLTGHSQEVVSAGKPFKETIERFDEFWKGTVLVAHNAPFDMDMLKTAYKRLGRDIPPMIVLDTLQLARVHRTDLGKHGLGPLTKAYEVELENHHRADEDAKATGEILTKMIVELLDKGIATFEDINNMRGNDYFKTIFPTKEVRIWVKTQAGLKNLYKLISESHTTFLNRTTPVIPKRIIEQYREGLIIGSAGIEGHLFELALNKMPEQVLEAAEFYDVLEVQPLENASHFPRENRAQSMNSIIRSWKTIYEAAKKLGKMVVATNDVKYEKKEHRLPHHMLLYKALSGRDYEKSPGRIGHEQGYSHFRTTDEMMEEFPWLTPEERLEIIVTNPNKLAESVEKIEIIPKELFTPKIEGANEELEGMVMDRAHELYGNPLPEYVKARLDKELKAILGYGFGVIYLISQKLVKKSVDGGYLVGSRGSVGSSLVATMSGITEVNPLKPHYHCTNCQWSVFFDNEEIQSGYDLPRNFKTLFNKDLYTETARQHFGEMLKESLGEETVKQIILSHEDDVCPKCNEKALKRDGQDIPFETFLGFKGDKVPDIDLNFSGVYQNTIHRYVEELFGAEYVFRAGTVGTVAENTAFGYVKAYVNEHKEAYQNRITEIREMLKNPDNKDEKEQLEAEIEQLDKQIKSLTWSGAEIARLSEIINGSRRTSGQHPGGMLVVPDYKDIHDFTPYQYPANNKVDKKTGLEAQQTSHFDFHAIHDNILKLDILGHDDPTELHILQELTGIDPKDVPANDEKVLKLFTNAEEVGIPLSRIEAKTGTLGIPEFGTEFVQEMILDTKPTTFAELVKISGLSHGTDVWLNNAQELVRNGITTLKEVIGTRDEIMVRLMQYQLEDSLAFTIMESVRKGKGLTPDMQEKMVENNVPQWYMDSCKKIKYMFPKAHAAAYVLSALRIGYFKVYHPIEYYCAHLSVRSFKEDITEIMKDSEMLRLRIRELADIIQKKKNARPSQSFSKEKELKDALDLVLEAKERGVKFAPPRIYGSKANEYIIDGDTLVAPFSSIPGIGDTAAKSLAEAAQQGVFRGVADMQARTKADGGNGISTTVIDALRQLGCLELVEETQHTFY